MRVKCRREVGKYRKQASRYPRAAGVEKTQPCGNWTRTGPVSQCLIQATLSKFQGFPSWAISPHHLHSLELILDLRTRDVDGGSRVVEGMFNV